ncbi:hypothetical protein VTN31DRAFT_5315 [Thermomyces dupontii]|uniref:uncharacterized protein n=1 Tax=Talaromyces thermophilus TaxID=28565 RepID=UPI00374469A6
MYYDIVGSLPLELLVQIVEYLDLEDIVRSQRVSKRWRTIFSCRPIIAPFLREALAFLGLDEEGVSTDVAMADAMSYIRWRYGLEHARPVKKVFLPWREPLPRKPDETFCCSRRLCYNVVNRNEAEIFNLETGETSIWTDPGRAALRRLALSDRYLVMIFRTWGYDEYHDLTVWDIHTKHRFSHHVPSFCARCLIVGDKLVLAPSPQRSSFPVYVWDLSLDHFQEIGSFSHLKLCHVDPTDNVLVAFEIGGNQPPEVQQTKWLTTTGQLLEKKNFYLQVPADCPVKMNVELFRSACRTYGRKTVAQWMFWNDRAPIYYEYDYTIDRLDVRWIDRADAIVRWGLIYRSVFLTRNLVYRFLPQTKEIVVYNVSTGAETLQSLIGEQGQKHPLICETDSREFNVFGDREVFGVTNKIGVELWFFNPNFAPDLVPGGLCSAPEVIK